MRHGESNVGSTPASIAVEFKQLKYLLAGANQHSSNNCFYLLWKLGLHKLHWPHLHCSSVAKPLNGPLCLSFVI
eukprot:1380102-Amphidinium_carterae.2